MSYALNFIIMLFVFFYSIASSSLEGIELKGNGRSVIVVDGSFTVPVLLGANPVMQYRSDDIFSDCMSSVGLSGEFEFSEGYIFARYVEKLPLGLYGGEGTCVSGGCSVDNRDGFSVRLIEKSGTLGLYIYDRIPGVSIRGRDYGRSLYSSLTMQPKISYHINVGVQQGGQGDFAILEVDGEVVLRVPLIINGEGWCTKGVLMTFMWGGDVENHKNWSVKGQSFIVRGVAISAHK